MRLLPLNEDYWRHGIVDLKDAKMDKIAAPITPIENAIQTMRAMDLVAIEVKRLEDRLIGNGEAEAAEPAYFGEPSNLLGRLERGCEDASTAMGMIHDSLRRIERALFGSCVWA